MKNLINFPLKSSVKFILITLSCFLATMKLPAQHFGPMVDLPPGDVRKMGVYNDNLYLIIDHSLYRYDGIDFFLIPLPAGMEAYGSTQPYSYEGRLYLLLNNIEEYDAPPSYFKVFGFDGRTFTEVTFPEGVLPTGYSLNMINFQGKLYIDVSDAYFGDCNAWAVFNGSEVIDVVKYPEGYIKIAHDLRIIYDKLYINLTHRESETTQLVAYNGSTFTFIDEPFGNEFGASMEIYNNELYMRERLPSISIHESRIIKYDGTGFSVIPSPVALNYALLGKAYAGGLYNIYSNSHLGPFKLYLYDGRTQTNIPWPAGIDYGYNFVEWRCKLFMEGSGKLFYLQSSCFPIIPEKIFSCNETWGCRPLFNLEIRFEDYQWNAVTGKWKVEPGYKDTPLGLSLSDKKGKIFWSGLFKNGFKASIPTKIKGDHLNVFLGKDKYASNIFQFDETLAKNGISTIAMELQPQQGKFYLKLSTKTKKKVPVIISMINKKGKEIWKGQFTAPFFGMVEGQLPEVGEMLRFSCPSTKGTKITELSPRFNYYPNPVERELTIDIPKEYQNSKVEVSVQDFTGNIIYQKDVHGDHHRIPVNTDKAGIYILIIKTEGEVRRERIWIK